MEGRGPQILAVNIPCFILSWLAVGLRAVVRGVVRKSMSTDDFLMIGTQLAYTIYLICQIGGVIYGTGRHLVDLTTEHAEKALQFWWFCEIFYIISASLLKLSVGLFLLRIAIRTLHIWVLRLLMLGTLVFGTFYFFLAVFQCRPVSDWWSLHRRGCIGANVIDGTTYAAATLNAVADWTFGLLPIFIVRDLKVSRRMKAAIAGILGLAAVGSTATVIRIPYIRSLRFTPADDFLWRTTDIAIWSTVEIGIGVIAACLATLQPLLQAIVARTRTRSPTYGHGPIVSGRFSKRKPGSDSQSVGLTELAFSGDTIAMRAMYGEKREAKGWQSRRGSEDDTEAIVRTIVTTFTETRADDDAFNGVDGTPLRLNVQLSVR